MKKIKVTDKAGYPMTAGIMELSVSASLQGYASLLDVPELVQKEKLPSNQWNCGYFVAIAGAIFTSTSTKQELSDYGYGTSLIEICLGDFLTTTSMDAGILITFTITPFAF